MDVSGTFYGNQMMRKGSRSSDADRAIARGSTHGILCRQPGA
jgi:hypothetical protein